MSVENVNLIYPGITPYAKLTPATESLALSTDAKNEVNQQPLLAD